MNKEDRLPEWLYPRDLTAKLIFYFKKTETLCGKANGKNTSCTHATPQITASSNCTREKQN
jgi:hypothetical protein